jgi:D-xylose transport system permease protein
VFIGLALVWALFQAMNNNFLSSRNLSNLVLQIAVLATLSLGLVLVLVLGEIDLSVGAIAGLSASAMAVLLTQRGWPTWAALGAMVAIAAAIGFVQGLTIVRIGIPSFIVTLAGLLIWQGIQLAVLGDAGQVPIRDPFIKGIASTYVSPGLGWLLGFVAVAAYAAGQFGRRRARMNAGLRAAPMRVLTARVASMAVVAAIVITVLNGRFGLPWVLVLVMALVGTVSVVMRDTPFGRHVHAIGGNREAARRAGIKVPRVTVIVFVLAAVLASLAGLIETSREFSVSNALGGGTLQLDAIAAVVIGGTSLFGGRGRAYHAVLGALVVGSVENGLDLLGQSSAIKNVATGLILILAVSVDALSRRRRLARGAGA